MYNFYDIQVNKNIDRLNSILEVLGDNMDFILKVNQYINNKLISINKNE